MEGFGEVGTVDLHAHGILVRYLIFYFVFCVTIFDNKIRGIL